MCLKRSKKTKTKTKKQIKLNIKEIMGLYATGRTTGIALNVGFSNSRIISVFDGFCNTKLNININVGGSTITDKLSELLSNKISFEDWPKYRILEKIKKNFCYVRKQFFTKDPQKVVFKLPDNTQIELKEERYLPSESIFGEYSFVSEQLIPKNKISISESIFHMASALFTQEDYDVDSFNNVLVFGSSSHLEGFSERLEHDFRKVDTNHSNLKFHYYPSTFHNWTGGSILASLSNYGGMWVSKHEYEEYGPDVINRKCL